MLFYKLLRQKLTSGHGVHDDVGDDVDEGDDGGQVEVDVLQDPAGRGDLLRSRDEGGSILERENG